MTKLRSSESRRSDVKISDGFIVLLGLVEDLSDNLLGVWVGAVNLEEGERVQWRWAGNIVTLDRRLRDEFVLDSVCQRVLSEVALEAV